MDLNKEKEKILNMSDTDLTYYAIELEDEKDDMETKLNYVLSKIDLCEQELIRRHLLSYD